ncbi:MAG: class I SAM-dependent methyltransferase [Thermodesulfovibrionales bacterium]|nr:class I SAM-dependent methyltransferase [Thermodesulfovibrionales bacterium]
MKIRPELDSMASVFDSCAEDYDRWFDNPEGTILFKTELAAVRSVLHGVPRPYLEIGVGTRKFARELGIQYGIDPAMRMLRIAEARGIEVHQATGEFLPFGGNIFGGVFILCTLCFVQNPEQVLHEAQRVLRKNGGLIVGILNRESPWGRLYTKKKEEGHPIYRHAHFFSVPELSGLIRKSGLFIEAYASALLQLPSEEPHEEKAYAGALSNAGFLCILARKNGRQGI